jgi:glyoxylase-like metal-dependent hydrolase (beta-lactamase superfamily II)
MQTPEIRSYDHGIHSIDAGFVRPGLAASHLVVRDGRAAFVDAGTGFSVPRLLDALDALGVSRHAVDYVLLTHVHLDHAGGAGALLQALPGAIAVVHPRGAGHMADPARLVAGARAVYGDPAYDALYGPVEPIATSRIRAVADGEVVTLGGSPLRVLETTGHALHHVAFHDEASAAVFAGDAFGISYRAFDAPDSEPFIFATSSPTQFDPAQAHASVERIRALSPRAVYLGHFGEVTSIDRLADDLHRDLDRFVAIATETDAEAGDEGREQMARAMHDHLTTRLDAHGPRLDRETRDSWLAMDARLNVAGLVAWRERLVRERERTSRSIERI